jgi:RNA polymerase sigma factor (sigma-70 family)
LDIDEHLLVERACQGDLESYSPLVKRYSNAVYAIAYSVIGDFHDAQDIAQEVFVKAWHNINRLKDKRKFGSWLFTITKRLSIDWLKKVDKTWDPLDDATHISDSFSVEERVEVRERKNVVWNALNTLDEKYRQVIILYFISGFNTREISNYMKISVSSVESRLRRSKQKLKEELVELIQETLPNQKLGKEFEQRVVKRITGVACINLPVSNVDVSKNWYVHHLGCTLIRDTLRGNGVANCFIKLGEGPTVLLHEEREKYNLHFIRNGEPAPIFELLTEDVKDFFDQLIKEGVTVIGDINESSCGDRFQVCDPDGNRITIIQS